MKLDAIIPYDLWMARIYLRLLQPLQINIQWWQWWEGGWGVGPVTSGNQVTIFAKNCNKIIIRMRRRSVSNKGGWASVRQLERRLRIRRNMNLPPNAPAASILRQLRFLIFYSFFGLFMIFFCFFIPFFCFLIAKCTCVSSKSLSQLRFFFRNYSINFINFDLIYELPQFLLTYVLANRFPV